MDFKLNRFIFLVSFFVLSFAILAQGQTGTIVGNITTENGESLPGAAVILKGTTYGTATDMNGKFTLENVPAGQENVEVRFQGYKTLNKEVSISENQTLTLNLVLEEQVYEMNEVMVTTQKREQTSIEVPVAISAMTSKSLETLNLVDFDALSDYVPGLQMQLQSPNNPGFVIRGITSDDGDSRVQPRVSVYQDGVSISRSRGAAVELFDMERVEVVKGPQGTLFGRGAQIGAVHLIQNKPTESFDADLKLHYGSYNEKLVSGFLNTPIKQGSLYNRLAFHYNERNGFVNNISGGKLNGKMAIAVRDIIRWTPGKNTTVDLIMNYQHDDYPGTAFKSMYYAPAGGDTDAWTDADLESGDSLGILRDVQGATLKVNAKLSDKWDLTSNTAYRSFYSNEMFDADGTAAPALLFKEISKSKQMSQELRFNYDDGNRFHGFAGADFFYEDGSQYVPWYTNEKSFLAFYLYLTDPTSYPAPVISGVPYTGYTDATLQGLLYYFAGLDASTGYFANASLNEYHEEAYTNYGTTKSYEVFADGTYDITEKLSATVGIRLTYEDLTGGYNSNSSSQPSYLGYFTLGSPGNILFEATNGKVSESKDYTSYVGRFVLNYMAGNNNIYASVSKGRRPGVISISSFGAALETNYLQPEIVWSYEAGMKGKALNSALNYDLSVYYYDWDHFQTSVNTDVTSSTSSETTVDAGKAHSLGLEVGARYYFSRTSNVFANYSYIDGEFNDEDSDGNPQDYAGNTFRLTPKNTFSAGLDLNFNFAQDKNSFYVRPSYTYKSKVYFEDKNTEELSQDGYGLVNLTAGFVFKRKQMYQIGFFGKNMLDEKFLIDAGNTGDKFGTPTAIAGARQVMGVELNVRF